jgi:hypothetical protein
MSVIKKDKYISKSFRASEFRCKCRRPECDAIAMNPFFIEKLQSLRDSWGLPLIINSGSRCSYWNALLNGAPDSQHVLGLAADIHLESPEHGPKLAALAEKVGMGGIGIGLSFIHVDAGPDGRRWSYDY